MSESAERTPRTMDIQGIMDLLPHRYPILLVDRILDYEPGKWIRGLKNISISDPIFLGHFPRRAVFPGVLIVEAMAQTGGCLMLQGEPEREKRLMYFMTIDKVKFRSPVVPGDQLILEAQIISYKGRVCKIKGVASVDGKKVAEAELMSMMVDVEKGEAQ
jgi:beta-hydroxyacyl-ACP dehydratase FabZ